MVSKTNFFSLNFWCKTSRLDISSLQGLHQVAQKLRKIIFPSNCFIPTFSPFKSFKEKSGAFLSPLIGLIPIFKKRSSSPPAAVKEKLTKTRRIAKAMKNGCLLTHLFL